MTSWDDLDQTERADLDAIRSAFERAKELAPSDPRWSPGSVRTEREIGAVEARLDLRLPAALRAYFLAIGDGGAGFPLGGIPKLETIEAPEATARSKHSFPLDPPQFLALQRQWIELELRRLERRHLVAKAAREGRLESLLADARSEDEREDIVGELVKEGFAILEGQTSVDVPDPDACRAGIALVALGNDEVRIGRALLMARAFAELETFARSVLADAGAVRVARDRATVHLVVALAALGRGAEIVNLTVAPELAYMSPYKSALHRAVSRLDDAAKREVLRSVPLRVAVDLLLAQDDVGARLAVDVADRLVRVAVADVAMENHAYNAGNRLVDALDDELEDVASELAPALARLLVYVDASRGRFDILASAADGEIDDGADAKKKGTAWLLAHEAELTGGAPTQRAKERFDQLRASA